MKKIIVICSLILSCFAFAQESDNSYVYDEPEMSTMAEGDAPAGPGDPNPAPIDDYVPALLIIALGMIVFYKKRHSISE